MSRLLEFKIDVLLETHLSELEAFEKEILRSKCDQGIYVNAMEAEISSWSSPSRQESLESYLPKGWSFSVRDLKENKLLGYFLGQPLLFFQKQTQVLWIEHMMALSEAVYDCLIEVAYRQAREKHLQRVYFANCEEESVVSKKIEKEFTGERWAKEVYVVATTKGAKC